MKSIITFGISSFIFLTVGAASAETWKVAEGDKGNTGGIWTITTQDTTITGSAAMLGAAGRSIIYQVAGEVRDGKVVLHRVAPSDGQSCTYVVEVPRSTTFVGSALCGGVSYPWHVTRTPKVGL